MNISLESLVKQALCAALAVALTVLFTQGLVRDSGLSSPATQMVSTQG
jgi:hypothetical protein